MAKMKHSIEWMVARINDYLDDKGSYETIAKNYGIRIDNCYAIPIFRKIITFMVFIYKPDHN